jgi:hypothetical protein
VRAGRGDDGTLQADGDGVGDPGAVGVRSRPAGSRLLGVSARLALDQRGHARRLPVEGARAEQDRVPIAELVCRDVRTRNLCELAERIRRVVREVVTHGTRFRRRPPASS